MSAVTPESFMKGDEAPRRVGGIEAEYDTQFDSTDDRYDTSLLNAELLSRLGLRYCNNGNTSMFWLTNGGVLHPDVSRIEFSGGECDAAEDIAASDAAGLEITADLVAAGKARLYRHSGTMITRQIDREVVDSFKSLGHHRNRTSTLQAASIYNARSSLLLDLVDTNQATRFWAWAGMVGKHGFELSQKGRGIGSSTSFRQGLRTEEGAKPMGWVKLSDSDVYRTSQNIPSPWVRVEERVVDAGFSRWASWMSEATGSLMLRFVERADIFGKNMPLNRLQLVNPVEVLHIASTDLTLSTKFANKAGERLTVIEMNELIGEYGDYLRQRIYLPKAEHEAVDELYKIATDARNIDIPNGDLRAIGNRVDFAARLKYLLKKGFPIETLTCRNRDAVDHSLLWSRVEPIGPGLTHWNNLYDNEKFAGKVPDPVGGDLIDYYYERPCSTTRAAIRGLAVATPFFRYNPQVRISWPYISNGASDRIIWLEPYDTDPGALNYVAGHRVTR